MGIVICTQDCSNKLIKQVCSNSKIGPKIHCGRIKAEAFVENVLCVRISTERNTRSCSPISVASNKGNQKMYPVAVRYFLKEYDVKTAIFYFYEDSNYLSQSLKKLWNV